MNLSEVLELGPRPIRADAPAGDPARDGPEFELLQSEIRKLEAPDQPTVNWERVTSAAHSILSAQSKDLLVASYLTVALYETDGYPGLVAGLTLLRDYVDQFWETCFPDIKRLRGRSAAFEWLNERGARALERGGKRLDAEAIPKSLELVGALDDKIGSLLDSPPLLGEIRRAIEEASNNMPQPSSGSDASAGVADSGATAVESYAPSSSSGPPRIESIASPEDLGPALEELARLADVCATYLRANEPADPLGYRMLRMLYWRQLREVPPNEDGRTVLPDFDTSLLDQLEQLLSSGEHAAVLEQTEAAYLSAPLWFDLSRYAVLALEGRGNEYKPAADAVVFEMNAMLKRVPDVVKLQTTSGVPFADEATKKWIAKRVMAGAPIDFGPSTDAPAGARPRGGETFAAAQKEARKMGRGSKLGAALKLLTDGAQKAERLDDRVVWKLEAARLCMQAGRNEMALAQLEALDEELRHSSIEDWDPALCAEILRDLLRCRQQVAQSADFSANELAHSRELMGRLVRLDVVSALELNGRE
jgi:type VI secretion system protein VasJ